MKSTRLLAAIAAGGLLLAACGGGSATDSAASPDVTAAAAPAAPGDQGSESVDDAVPTDAGATADATPAALQFTAPLVGGGELDASTLAGKPTVFWFWAPT
jgi:hypothetical protein